MFDQLIGKIKSMRKRSRSKAAYRTQLLAAVEDGVLSAEESVALENAREDLGLTSEDVRRIRVTAYKHAFQVAASDRRITAAEASELDRIRTQLGVDGRDTRLSVRDLQRFRMLGEIQDGNLPVTTVPGLLLQKNEIAHWAEPGHLIEERVLRRRYGGSSSGTSIHIMKGLTYRVGSHRGQLVTDTGNVPVSAGLLIVTNSRVIFMGDRKSFNYRFDKIIGIQLFSDGLSLSESSGKNRLVRFQGGDNGEIVGAILSQAVNLSR